MALHTMFGINGIGKDTVAESIKSNHSDLIIVSESRALMYILGISPTYESSYSPTRDQYKALEDYPQSEIISIESNELGNLMTGFDNDSSVFLSLAHLVYALHVDKDVTYLTKPKPEWYAKVGRSFIELVAPPELILERRNFDSSNRDRQSDGLQGIVEHQTLCDFEWDRLVKNINGQIRTEIIENVELDKCIADVESIIYA